MVVAALLGTAGMIATLKHRSEFLRIRGGARWSTPAFVMETKPRGAADQGAPRFGFTVTKQLGKAVIRSRIRRRLREAVRHVAPTCAKAGHDYVLIARGAALDRDFAALEQDLTTAFSRVHRPAKVKAPDSGA